MFTVALFTIMKLWKQPKYPWTGELMKKMWYIHNGILFRLENEGNFSMCNNIGELGEHYVNKINQAQKEKHCIYLAYMWK